MNLQPNRLLILSGYNMACERKGLFGISDIFGTSNPKE